ncbi:uncharacterized protein AAEQ78_015699 isoform 1-T1 [Lycaon pictus]
MAAPFPDTEGCLAFLTVILGFVLHITENDKEKKSYANFLDGSLSRQKLLRLLNQLWVSPASHQPPCLILLGPHQIASPHQDGGDQRMAMITKAAQIRSPNGRRGHRPRNVSDL